MPNGTTRYYAVTAFDHADNESPLSAEEVWDTPRPEGYDVTLANALHPDGYLHSGFDLSAEARVPHDDTQCDFWYEYDPSGGVHLLYAGSSGFWPDDATEIQDMGWTSDLAEIDFAPPDAGWSPTQSAEAIAAHTYVLVTRGGNYAKIRVTDVGANSITFDWAFQGVPWNRQLIAPVTP